MTTDFSVRLFELQADGKLEALQANDIEYFGGACPNVGDTIGQINDFGDAYHFYSVQRRVFVDIEDDTTQGWALIVRRAEESPILNDLMTAWIDGSASLHDAEQQEAAESLEYARGLARALRDGSQKGKPGRKPKSK
ncbi:hypothetical protein D3C87_1539810 [compost metagenome]